MCHRACSNHVVQHAPAMHAVTDSTRPSLDGGGGHVSYLPPPPPSLPPYVTRADVSELMMSDAILHLSGVSCFERKF